MVTFREAMKSKVSICLRNISTGTAAQREICEHIVGSLKVKCERATRRRRINYKHYMHVLRIGAAQEKLLLSSRVSRHQCTG